MHTTFVAETQHAHGIGSVEVIPVLQRDGQTLMTVCTEEYPIYITKAQAMEFFGLVETTGSNHWNALTELAGTFMDGGGRKVSLIQDDATREYGIKVGGDVVSKHQRAPRTYWAGSFESAVQWAYNEEAK